VLPKGPGSNIDPETELTEGFRDFLQSVQATAICFTPFLIKYALNNPTQLVQLKERRQVTLKAVNILTSFIVCYVLYNSSLSGQWLPIIFRICFLHGLLNYVFSTA
jgi:hypothetical protein